MLALPPKPDGLFPADFCDWLRGQIRPQCDAAFGYTGILILYSGPIKAFKEALARLLGRPVKSIKNNKERGKDQGKPFGSNILDDTPIGKWIEGQDWVAYFKDACGGKKKLVDAAIYMVWRTVSEELIRSAFGKAKTAVCGADPTRVFRRHELPQLLKETKLDTINSLPIQLVEDFSKMGIVEAFRQICKFELLSLRYQSRQAATKAEADALREEWRERWSLYKQHLQYCRKGRKPQSPKRTAALRNRRKRKRARYDFKAIKETIITDNAPAQPILSTAPISLAHGL